MMPDDAVHELRQVLFVDPALSVYAVLDGASISDLLPSIDRHRPEFVCLYRGELSRDAQETAPYLVRLERDAAFTTWLLQEGWGSHWGIFAVSAADFRTMRKHFRTFLMIHSHEGKPLYFRYYDPRVLRAFLPNATADQLDLLLGPVESYVVEAKDASELLRFRHESGEAVVEQVALTQPTAVTGGTRVET